LRLIIHNLDVAVRDKDGIPSHLKMMRKHIHNPMVTITSGKRRQSENSCYPTTSREFTIEPNVWKCRATVMGHPKIGHDTPRNMAKINTAMESKPTRPPIHPSSTLSGNDDIEPIADMTGARGIRWWSYRVWPRAQPSSGNVTPLDEKVLRQPARPHWTPVLPSATPGEFRITDLLTFAGVAPLE